MTRSGAPSSRACCTRAWNGSAWARGGRYERKERRRASGARFFFFNPLSLSLSPSSPSLYPHSQISSALLPRWDETALRIKASRLLGTQSLARYPGWRGDRAAVAAEAARNRAVGEAAGCWKGGVLVDDGSGAVPAAFAALEAREAVGA